MTREEATVWNKVHDYAQKRYGYSVVDMQPIGTGPTGNESYTIKLNQLGASAEPRQITIFFDVFRSIVTSHNLPEAVKQNIDAAVQ
jgi:hypothetical protein